MKRKIHFITSESIQLGMLLALVGGFLDAYTFVCRGGVFANAQTGNLVLIGVQVYAGHFLQALLTTAPILAFILGVLLVEKIKDSWSMASVRQAEKAILLLEMLVLFLVGFVPATVPHVFVIIAIAFVASVQTTSFKKLVDSPYSTTMCTGNLRSATEYAYRGFSKRDKRAMTISKRYALVLLWFLLGCFLGAMLTLLLGVKAVWCPVLVLGVAVFLLAESKPDGR